jgi:hypothetical protein
MTWLMEMALAVVSVVVICCALGWLVGWHLAHALIRKHDLQDDLTRGCRG